MILISQPSIKMEKFTDPNGMVKEMKFYTPEEFKKIHFMRKRTRIHYII